MVTQLDTCIRRVDSQDRRNIANLIHFELKVHRNLDWKPPLDWIGDDPYFALERGNRFLAALACPPDPPEIAWIRLFAVHSTISDWEAWNQLWPSTLEQLKYSQDVHTIAAIPIQGWFREILKRAEFLHNHDIVVYTWIGKEPPKPRNSVDLVLRPMIIDDIPDVESVDYAAFKPLWRNSSTALSIAYKQASLATVIEKGGRIIGYQISTSNQMGGHLARLAVDPAYQGQGVGYNLVYDLLSHFKRRGANQVTVNTQSDNLVSIALYEKMGFSATGETFPVFVREIS